MSQGWIWLQTFERGHRSRVVNELDTYQHRTGSSSPHLGASQIPQMRAFTKALLFRQQKEHAELWSRTDGFSKNVLVPDNMGRL